MWVSTTMAGIWKKPLPTKQFGVTDTAIVKDIYQSMIAEPGNYLNYILGCIEFRELKEDAQEKAGDAFNLRDFHEFILSTGPASFDVLNDRLKDLY